MNAWDEARLGGRPGGKHMLGLWDPRHHLSALGWMPPVSERRKVFGKQRFSYALNVNLAGSSVGSDRFTCTGDFWWTDTIASYQGNPVVAQVYPSFSVQLFDTKNQRRYMNFAEFVENLGGTIGGSFGDLPAGFTKFPYFHRRITRIPAGAVIVARIQNLIDPGVLAGSTVPLQVVLGGYTD
jgi:hypothetical protein